METFTELKKLEKNPNYQKQREKSLDELTDDMIDTPIIELIRAFKEIPYCFTLQCCYGHFLYSDQEDPNNLDPLPITHTISSVEYRIAYIAFCIENNFKGRNFFEALQRIPVIDPENIQFCSASWFWKRQVNSYALQVEPNRFKHDDKAILDYNEALRIEKTRNEFFEKLRELILYQQYSEKNG